MFSEPSSSDRFGPPVTAEQLRNSHVNAIPKKTRDNNAWAVSVWRDWADHRNQQPETAFEVGFPIALDVAKITDLQMLDYWLQRFVVEIRRKDKKPYPGETLVQICSALQRHLRFYPKFKSINLFKTDDPTFSQFRNTLDARMKELISMGIGTQRSSSDPITREDEETLWASGVLSLETSTGLSNAVFLYNGKCFGFRGFQEHMDCHADQFELGYDQVNKTRYVRFIPRIRKNLQGGLKHRKINVEPITHYEQVENERSVYRIFEKYLNLIPHKGPFYRKPLAGTDENNNVRFSAGTIPQATMKNMLKNMFSECNLDVTNRKITNHSTRVTLCSTLYNNKFNDKAVSSRSHHRSNAMHAYQREAFDMLKDISNHLDSKTPCSLPRNHVDSKPPGSLLSNDLDRKPPSSLASATSSAVIHEENAVKTESCTPMSSATCINEDEETLMVSVPMCVNKIVVMKGSKRIVMQI
jgi:hypothetical protein